jgi:polyisoprenoid-binding protein YceI
MQIRHAVMGSMVAAAFALALGFGPRLADPAARAAAAASAQAGAAGKFTVDPVHSSVIFRIEHEGVANFYGAFKEIEGSFTLGDDPSQASFDLSVKVNSVDTRNENRDKHLRTADFFNVAEFPFITFKSKSVEKAGDKLKVTGDLTMHGVTRPITLEVKTWPAKDTEQGRKAGVETIFTIKRSDFGMDTYVAEGRLGDEVTLMVACEGKG